MDGLNELLYAELLAVKRTLGAEHETAIIKAFREQLSFTPAQVRGAAILLLVVLLFLAWRLWTLP